MCPDCSVPNVSGQAADTSPVAEHFIREIERTGMTNQEVARALNVSERQVTRWRGGQEPRYAVVVRMAKVFERPVAWFYDPEQKAAA